jgi:pantetheine-phosphate adenylyltransferase
MKALYAGSFDPITNGHMDIIMQAIEVFDKVAIGVANNPKKTYMFKPNERVTFIERSLKDVGIKLAENIEVFEYYGMTVEWAEKVGARFLIRGLRAVSDFDAEFQMIQFNRKLPPGCNTVFFMPDEENFYLSSTAIREIIKMGGTVREFVPRYVFEYVRENYRKRKYSLKYSLDSTVK